ncbi:hypothetical protein [Hoeflea poritis]|uniref:Uncharacterized protein n=1 Tax=Hoeflea poritis TaxID=2993659 RepID=A0ABT4VTE0_9HYPH|nr:hypothetical protein [Hoeflea poritis]MDA4847981.1 hypothetical protein [Hoeflea poritis]
MTELIAYKPFTVLAIIVLAVATAMGWIWMWGLLYMYWAVMGPLTGSAFVVESVDRDDNPVLFWIISAAWFAAGIWTFVNGLGLV